MPYVNQRPVEQKQPAKKARHFDTLLFLPQKRMQNSRFGALFPGKIYTRRILTERFFFLAEMYTILIKSYKKICHFVLTPCFPERLLLPDCDS